MASQTALKPESEEAKGQSQSGFIVEAEKLLDRRKELYQGIEQRAYELFAERGYEIGHDAEDWFRAESECLLKVPVEISESDTTIVARAEMPGFTEKEINVSIEAHRLLISASLERRSEEKEDDRLSIQESAREVFCSLPLPYEVEANQAQSSFKDGLLEITIPRLVARDAPAREAEMK